MDRTALSNLALDHLGVQGDIQDWEEESREAQVCKLHYETALAATLRSFDWGFARSFRWGARIVSEEGALPGYEYRYAYPADAARVRSVHTAATIEDAVPYKFLVTRRTDGEAGRMIHCRIAPALICYTAIGVPETDFDPMFVNAFSYELAAAIALPLTRDAKQADLMAKKAKAALDGAEVASANEGIETMQDPEPDFISVRGTTG